MNHSECVITGCNFLDAEQERWIHGDLHQLWNVLIFNANGCEWVRCIDTPLSADECCVKSPLFYEKNQQIVFPLEAAQFNDVANAHLNKWVDAKRKQIITFGNAH